VGTENTERGGGLGDSETGKLTAGNASIAKRAVFELSAFFAVQRIVSCRVEEGLGCDCSVWNGILTTDHTDIHG